MALFRFHTHPLGSGENENHRRMVSLGFANARTINKRVFGFPSVVVDQFSFEVYVPLVNYKQHASFHLFYFSVPIATVRKRV